MRLCFHFRSEGVRVRHPHGHHVWTEPESTAARDGLATGVPLRVALEGHRAGRFRLDVTSCIGTDGGSSGGGAGGGGGGGGGEGGGEGGGFDGAAKKGVRSVLCHP